MTMIRFISWIILHWVSIQGYPLQVTPESKGKIKSYKLSQQSYVSLLSLHR